MVNGISLNDSLYIENGKASVSQDIPQNEGNTVLGAISSGTVTELCKACLAASSNNSAVYGAEVAQVSNDLCQSDIATCADTSGGGSSNTCIVDSVSCKSDGSTCGSDNVGCDSDSVSCVANSTTQYCMQCAVLTSNNSAVYGISVDKTELSNDIGPITSGSTSSSTTGTTASKGIYFGSSAIKSIYYGSLAVSQVWFGNTKIWPQGAFTYELKNISIKYSSGSYLYPSASNYAYIEGTLITYLDGAQNSSQKVVCTPVGLSSDYIKLDSTTNYMYWNKSKYGKSAVTQSTASIDGALCGNASLKSAMTVTIGKNSVSLTGGSIAAFSVGGYYSPHTFSSANTVYPMVISGLRKYAWTSGYESGTVVTSAFAQEINITGKMTDYQDTQGFEGIFTLVNNGDEDVTLVVWVEDEFKYSLTEDSHTVQDTAYDSSYEECTIKAGESYQTSSIHADASEGLVYTDGTHSYRQYFKVGDSEYDFGKKGVSKTYTGVAYSNKYFTITSNSTNGVVNSNMTVELKANSGSSDRSITLTLKDKLLSSLTKTYLITQSK